MQTSYYKLTLSYKELQHLLSTTTDIDLQFKLSKMLKKLDAGLLKPAYIKEAKVKESLLDSLGGSSTDPTPDSTPTPVTIASNREQCYERYIVKDPSLSPEDIISALDHKDLVLKEELTPEEEAIINSAFAV